MTLGIGGSRGIDKFGKSNPELVLFAHSLDGPFLLAEGTAVVLFDPQRHAAVVKRVIALAPHNHAVLSSVKVLLALSLASKTRV